jgi:2-polyprenyl-6-methoxyphenol hydroxylase-like FAD-dependent oxidoreductase
VKFANGHSDEADVLVGADGIRSVVRRAIQGEQPPRYSGYTCWRGVCGRPNTLPEGSMGEWWGRGQRFGITAIPGNKIYWFAVQNASPDQHEADEREYLLRHYADWATPCLALIESTPRESILRNDIIDRVPNRNWSRGGMGIVGDAAHPTTPNLGQGGCMAIEDAVVLARCLVQAPDAATAWKKFAQERWPRTSAIVNKSWQFGRIAQRQGRVSCWVRDRLVGLLLRWLGPSEPLKFVRFDIGSLPEPGASSSSST